MVKIIKGTYGHYDGKRVVPITAADGEQRLAPEIEKRLVDKGVAVYVDNPDEICGGNIDYSTMKLPELKKLALSMGLRAEKVRSKSDVIALIEAAEDVEEIPTFTAAMPCM